MASATSGNHLLGRAQVFAGFLDASDNSKGMTFLGNVSEGSLSFSVDTVSIKDLSQASAPVVASAVTGKSASGKIKLVEWTKENIALFTSGTSGLYTQSSGTQTDTQIGYSITGPGVTLQLPHRKITSVTNVKQHATTLGSATTLTLTTDYTVDLTMGTIELVSTGAAVAGNQIWCTYVIPTVTTTVPQVQAGNANNYCSVLIKPYPAAGPQWMYYIYKALITGSGDLPLINESAFLQYEINLDVIYNTTNSEFWRATKVG